MSRLTFVLLLCILAVANAIVFNPFLTGEKLVASGSHEIVDAASCPNACSGNGQCLTSPSSSNAQCICNQPFIGVDCSVQAAMKSMCLLKGNTLCTYWAIQGDYIYIRLAAVTGNAYGWAAVGFGATNGMVNLEGTVVSVRAPLDPIAFDIYAAKKGMPTNLTQQSVAASNVSGASTSVALDVTFVRLLAPNMPQVFNIPAMAGTNTNVSFAIGSNFFSYHGSGNATMITIDIAAAASGSKQYRPADYAIA